MGGWFDLVDDHQMARGVQAGDCYRQNLFELPAQYCQGLGRGFDLWRRVWPFLGDDRAAHFDQRQRIFGQHRQRGHGPGHGHIILHTLFGLTAGIFSPSGQYRDAGQVQHPGQMLEKGCFLAGCFEQRQLNFGADNFERHTGKTGPAPHVNQGKSP